MNKKALPEGWRWASIGDVVREAQSGFACGERDINGVIQLRMNNVNTNGAFNWSGLTRVPQQIDNLDKFQLLPGDIVFNNTNSTELVGKSAYFSGYEDRVVYSNHFTRLRVYESECESVYLSFWLNNLWSQKVFEEICNRWIGQSAVKPDKLLSLDIPLPPLSEQKRIAAILTERLAAVERARKASEARLEAARALPAAYLREVFESEEARGWPRHNLGEFIFSARNGIGRRPSGHEDGPIVLRLADVSTGKVDITNPRRLRMNEEEKEKYSLKKGDLLFVRVNGSPDYIGKCIVLDNGGDDLSFNDHLIRVRIKGELQSTYVKLWALSKISRDYFVESASTSAGQLTINQSILEGLEIAVPPVQVQKAIIAEYQHKIEGVDMSLKALADENLAICSLPSSLLRQAFSGAL